MGSYSRVETPNLNLKFILFYSKINRLNIHVKGAVLREEHSIS